MAASDSDKSRRDAATNVNASSDRSVGAQPLSPEEVKVASQELASALIAAATEDVAIGSGLDPAAVQSVKSIDADRIADLISQIKESADKLAATIDLRSGQAGPLADLAGGVTWRAAQMNVKADLSGLAGKPQGSATLTGSVGKCTSDNRFFRATSTSGHSRVVS